MDRKLANILYNHWDNQAGVYMRLFDKHYSNPALRRLYYQYACLAAERANYYYHRSIVG